MSSSTYHLNRHNNNYYHRFSGFLSRKLERRLLPKGMTGGAAIEPNVCAAWEIADPDALIAPSWSLCPFSAPALAFEEEEGFRW